jgi:hypothetical protein
MPEGNIYINIIRFFMERKIQKHRDSFLNEAKLFDK